MRVGEIVKLNGEEIQIIEGKNLMEFLQESKYDTKKIALELNGEIIPKATYGNVFLKNGDSIEVVSFVGGG